MRNVINLDNALTAQEQTDVLQKIDEVRVMLEKYAINLTKDERKKARNVSDRRLSYVDALLRASKEFENVLPRDIDVTKFDKATKEFMKMKDVFIKLENLHELIDDTIVANGQLMMYYTDHVYNALQQARTRDAGLDNVLMAIEDHNKRTYSNNLSTEEEDGTEETPPTTAPDVSE